MLLKSFQLTCAIAAGLSLSALSPREAVARSIDCYGLYPTMTPNERDLVNQQLSDEFWSQEIQMRTDAEEKLSQRLALVYPGTQGDPTLEWRHWKVILRTHCNLLNSPKSNLQLSTP
jgi:hypothetical protein